MIALSAPSSDTCDACLAADCHRRELTTSAPEYHPEDLEYALGSRRCSVIFYDEHSHSIVADDHAERYLVGWYLGCSSPSDAAVLEWWPAAERHWLEVARAAQAEYEADVRLSR